MVRNKFKKEERAKIKEDVYNILVNEPFLSSNDIAFKMRGLSKVYSQMTRSYLNKMILPDLIKDLKIGKVEQTIPNSKQTFGIDIKQFNEASKKSIKAWRGKGQKPSVYFAFYFTNTLLKGLFDFYERFKDFDRYCLGEYLNQLHGLFMSTDFLWPLQKKFILNKVIGHHTFKVKTFSKNPFIDDLLRKIESNKEFTAYLATQRNKNNEKLPSINEGILECLEKIRIAMDNILSKENLYNVLNSKEN
jgi:hypothetical protein